MSSKLIALVAVCGAAAMPAHAFVSPSPPPGFGGGPGQWTVAPTPGDTVVDRVMRQSKVLPVPGAGGQKVSVAYRLGNAAGRVAAGAIFLNPYVRTAVGIATWLGLAKLVWDAANQKWITTDNANGYPVSDGYTYRINAASVDSGVHYSASSACSAWIAAAIAYDGIQRTQTGSANLSCSWTGKPWPNGASLGISKTAASSCPVGWYVTPAGCVQTPPPRQVTQKEFEDALSPQPMPQTVPGELPQPTPLPVEAPSPWVNPTPGSNPSSQPWRVPTGNPEPNPHYDPNAPQSDTNQPYRQPYTDYIPSPTDTQPWRLDTRPGYRQMPTPDGMTEPVTPSPTPNPSDKPTEKEQQDLCEKHPGIVACEDGEVNDSPLPDIPTLYERKYPDGLVGIWNQKSQLIKQASMFTLASQLMPTGLNAGACPAWQIELNFASWAAYGAHNVAPPCWIWDVAKTIILISALLLARALVFGG